MSMFEELKRRKVFRIGVTYIIAAWVVVQVASIAFPVFEAPAWALRVFIFICLLGFPLALALAWSLEMTADGVRVDQPSVGTKRFYSVVAALAILAIAWFEFGQPSYRASDVPADGEVSVAVLPFANMSGDPEQEYFSDGMTEEILNVLAAIPELNVAARTSVFQFKNQAADVRDIGRTLGVSHIIEGSVRRQGEQVRVTAQLIRVADGFHVWSENYDRKIDNIFALQDDIAQRIAEQFEVSLGGKQDVVRSDIPPEAYDEYLKGRDVYRRRGDVDEMVYHFERAVALAPDFADGWASLALANELVVWTDNPDIRLALWNSLEEMERAANRAAELAPEAPMTLHALGNVERCKGNYAAAIAYYRRALARDPSYSFGLEDLSEMLLYVGKDEEATAIARQLVALDPFVRVFRWRLLQAGLVRGDFSIMQEARDAASRAGVEETGPAGRAYHLALGNQYVYTLSENRIEAAREAMEKGLAAGEPWAERAKLYFDWAVDGDQRLEDKILASDLPMEYLAIAGRDEAYFDKLMLTVDHGGVYGFFAELRNPVSHRLLVTDRAKQLLRDYGYERYWREQGWPELCRPLGEDDFECGPQVAAAD